MGTRRYRNARRLRRGERARRARKRQTELWLMVLSVPILTAVITAVIYFSLDAHEDHKRQNPAPKGPSSNIVERGNASFGGVELDAQIVRNSRVTGGSTPQNITFEDRPYLLITLTNKTGRPISSYVAQINWSQNVTSPGTITLAAGRPLPYGQTIEQRIPITLDSASVEESRAVFQVVTASVTGQRFVWAPQ